jgi:ubiquinone/menaquinone biosynthesis C-methylase UbiE
MHQHRFDPVKHLARLESPARHLRQTPELVLPYLPDPGGVVADLGCGTGFFGRVLARYLRSALYLGLDPSAELLDHFASGLFPEEAGRVSLVRHERESLPLRNGSVSLLFMANILHEIVTDRGMLPEVARVVAPGGHLFLIDWKKRPTVAGPPFFMKVSRRRAVGIFEDLGFRLLQSPPVYPRHYCLLFAREGAH